MTEEVHNHSEGSPRNVIQAGSVRDIYVGSAPAGGRSASAVNAENDALDGLAREVLDQWRDEANVRGLRERVPMVIPWKLDQGHQSGPGEEHSERVGLEGLVDRVKTLSLHQLVITGPAGAGKSSLAVLLVVELLEGREPGSGEAVPVVLSLSGWEPEVSLQDWVIRRMNEDYGGLVRGFDQYVVKSLVQNRRIVPVLDGFDELPPLARKEAVKALKQAFGTRDPLVLASRPEAYQEAVDAAPFLRGVPVLRACPVPPEAGRAYLAQMCHRDRIGSWQSLFDAMESDPEGPVATTLSSPLMLWLAGTVYAPKDADPRELLDATRLPTQTDIEGHLLDGLIPAVCAQGPRPSYLPGPVRRWRSGSAPAYFRYLAGELHRRRTQDIAWWQMRSPLTEPGVWGAVVIIAVAVCGTSASYAIAGLAALLGASPPRPGLGIPGMGQVLGAVAAVAIIATAFGRIVTRHLFSGFDDRPRRPAPGISGRLLLAVSAVATAAVGVALPGSMTANLCLFALPLLAGVLLTRSAESEIAAKPRQLLRDERRIALVESAVVAPTIAGTSLAIFHWLNSDPLLIGGALLIGWSCSAAVLIALSRWGRWTATRLILAGRRHLPRDVLGFLEDGHQLGVLRRVGGIYQFRHAGLRERLAGEAVGGRPGSSAGPHEVVLKSSMRSVGVLRAFTFDLLALISVFLLVVSPMSTGPGFRTDLRQTWLLLVRWWPLLLAVLGVLALGALALRAVATRLRIDSECVELNNGRRLRLRWDDVAEVRVLRVRSRRNVETGSPTLNVSYCLAMKPVAGRETPRSLTDSDGWVRVWDLGFTEVMPLDLEVALSRFAADRWRRDV
ncbi:MULTISPECIES: NACHT domain-containing protein [unclassified Kitasatospora]|uniref:NACHT domain-containing protein n=1 Tax=unclassified Kitasatospora TaxID=2633591 RepID=UPI0033FEBD62